VGTCGTIDHVVLRFLIVVAIAFASRDARAQVFRPRGKLNVKPTPIAASIVAKGAPPAAPAAAAKATPTAQPAVEKKPARKVARKKKRRKSDDVVIEDEDDDVQIKDDE
jgi:hypothetical protein